ncbi:MAG TPA: GAF domain-containing protein, partial [Aequorivita sp.]|nr:GAF domain-containing protein [Aequorivita sp.]
MKKLKRDFPLKVKIGFKKVFEAFKENTPETEVEKNLAAEILSVEENFPELSQGISDFDLLPKYKEQIDTLLNPLFPSVLGKNEIKFATIPFQDFAFKSTQRYKNLIKAAGPDFKLDIINFDHDQFYIMGCSIILSEYYDRNVDFRRSYYYNIPDERGMVKNYRLLYNADFVEIQKTDKAKDISEEDINELLESFDDVSVWKEKFPPESWIFNGFVIASLTDVTLNVSISDFKSNL